MNIGQAISKYVNQQSSDYFENLIRESTKGRNDINRINECFQKQIEIETEYAKHLENLANLIQENDQAVNLQKILLIYAEQLKLKAQQTKEVIMFIKEQILTSLNSLVKDQTMKARQLTQDGRKLMNQLNQEKSDVEKLIQQLQNKNQEYNQHQIVKYSQEYSTQVSPQRRNENTMKSDKLYRNLKELKQKVKLQVQNYVLFLQGFDLRVSKIVEELETQDIQRLFVLKKILNELYENDNILKQMNKIELQTALYKYKDTYIKYLYIDYQEVNTFVQHSIEKTEENWFEITQNFFLKYQQFENNRQQITLDMDLLRLSIPEVLDLMRTCNNDLIYLIELCSHKIHSEMNLLWSSNDIDINNLVNLLDHNLLGRQIWINEFSQFRIQKKFEIDSISFLKIVSLLQLILNICLEEYDAYTVRKMILLSVTFYKTENTEKIFLYSGIKNHKIFESFDLWDAIFFESLHEEMKKQQIMRLNEETTDSIEREKNTIFGFQGSLIENILTFGQQKSNAKILIQKYSKMYMLTDQQIKQLIQIIENWKTLI